MAVLQWGRPQIQYMTSYSNGDFTVEQLYQICIDVAQETAANNVTLKIIILTSSIMMWIGCRLI